MNVTTEDTSYSEERKDYEPGTVVDGRYRIESLLGTGGMGMVYRVTQLLISKQFALKTLLRGQTSELRVRRFQQEARTAFALNHPNIISVKDFGVFEDGTPFLVMEFIEGETLSARLKRSGRLSIEEAIPIFVQTCFGLAYAHEQGVVHRDIKPSNIMLVNGITSGEEGCLKIVDFGIAKYVQSDAGEIQALTKTGEIFGSPFYMSPEQCSGERVDYRADIYSLGCVLFETLSGTPPCVGESALSTMMQHQMTPPPSLREASMGFDFPPELEKIVAKMLEKSPDKRYQNLGIVAHHLAALMRDNPDAQTLLSKTHKTYEPARAFETLTKKDLKAAVPVAKRAPWIIPTVCTVALLTAGATGYLVGHCQYEQQAKEIANLQQQIKILSNNSDRNKKAANENEGSLRLPPPKLIAPVSPTPVPSESSTTGFTFPTDISVGSLRIDQRAPISVVGEQRVNKKSKLTFYTRHASREFPELLDKFRDDDLSGLEVVFKDASKVVEKVKDWKRLQELTFFSSIIKALPRAQDHDETPVTDAVLPSIDKLTRLTTLGLCGRAVTGGNVAKMSLLRSIHTIKLKGVRNIEVLLEELASHPNITEVWLIDEKTDNHQLELLARMTNLKSLTIRRSSLEPDSFQYFLKMKNLKHLTIDRNIWSDSDRKKFIAGLPDCKFEPVFDTHFWFILPDQQKLVMRDEKEREQEQSQQQPAATVADSDSGSQFSLVEKFVQGKVKAKKVDLSQVLINSEEYETLGANRAEISMLSKYPFEAIRPIEREFEDRLKKDLKKSGKWSHN